MTGPRLMTVAVPTMNGSRHLVETLRSILRQREVDFDLIVSDDRSDDDTQALVRREAGDRARLVVNTERLGLAGNWNRCVALSRTPCVGIVHQDDLLEPDHLRAHREAFLRDESVGLVASAAGVIDDAGELVPESLVERGGLGPVDRTFPPCEAVPLLAAGNPLRCSAVSIRCSAHAEAGGFDASLRYVVDWDFWIRVSRLRPLAWLARPTVFFRWHPASETHRFKTGTTDLVETERVMEALFADLEVSDALRRDLFTRSRRRLARAYLNRAQVAVRGGDGILSRRCLGKALRLRPSLVSALALDPRLAAQMAAVVLAPGLAGRCLARIP